MPSIFGSLNTALRALQAMQTAIQTTGHNTANAATPGYSRQRVVLAASEPYTIPTHYRNVGAGQVGTGVSAQSVRRYHSDFLDTQIREQTWGLKGWEVQQDVLQQIQVVLNEPSDTGLNTYLHNFWAGWQDLAATPDSTSARAYVAETASELAASLRESYQQLYDLRSDLNDRIAGQVTKINDLAHRVADLNKTIAHVESLGQQPNDLRDQRNQVLKELSTMLNVTISESDSGSYWVSTGGRLLVADYTVSEMAVEKDTNNNLLNRVVWADSGAAVQVKGVPLEGGLSPLAADRLAGELGGALIGRDLLVNKKMDQLDQIADALMGAVNGLHQTGYDASGAQATRTKPAETLVPGTVDGFTLTTPWNGLSGMADGEFFVEIRDNNNTLEFRVVDAAGHPLEINDASVPDGSPPDPTNNTTSDWQTFSLVAGSTFDTGRGVGITFAPLADHSLGGGTVNPGDVAGFGLGGIPAGTPELGTDTYYVETREQPAGSGNWEFRVVDSGGAPVPTYNSVADDGSLTDGTNNHWQPIPASQTFDTRRGLTIDFAAGGPPYAGGTYPATASNVTYNARGTQVGNRTGGAAAVTLGNGFFEGSGARDIAVSNYITSDYNRIVTAAVPNAPGDGSIALAMAQLSSATLMNSGTTSIKDFYRSAIGNLGQEAQQADVMTKNHELLVNHLENRQEQISGVSLDEESVNLVKYQRTYQAAARIMTTVDEMLDRVINNMGLVGR